MVLISNSIHFVILFIYPPIAHTHTQPTLIFSDVFLLPVMNWTLSGHCNCRSCNDCVYFKIIRCQSQCHGCTVTVRKTINKAGRPNMTLKLHGHVNGVYSCGCTSLTLVTMSLNSPSPKSEDSHCILTVNCQRDENKKAIACSRLVQQMPSREARSSPKTTPHSKMTGCYQFSCF